MARSKKPTSIALAPNTKALLDLVLKHHKRNLSQMVEYWTENEAAQLKIKLPKDWKPPVEQE